MVLKGFLSGLKIFLHVHTLICNVFVGVFFVVCFYRGGLHWLSDIADFCN